MGQEYRNFTNSILVGASVVTVTSPFGMRGTPPTMHYGIDMTPVTLIKCPADGVVKSITTTASGGLTLVLQHGGDHESFYKHLKLDSIAHKVGDFVDKGLVIAHGGATGIVTGAHEHYEIHVKGVAVDPLPYLLGTKVIPPYVFKPTDIVSRPVLPVLRIKVVSNVRANAGIKGLDIGDTTVGAEYPYLGRTIKVDSFEWARVDFHGTIGYIALNPDWNEVVLPPEVYKPFEAEIVKEGMVLNVSLKPLVK